MVASSLSVSVGRDYTSTARMSNAFAGEKGLAPPTGKKPAMGSSLTLLVLVAGAALLATDLTTPLAWPVLVWMRHTGPPFYAINVQPSK